MSEDFPFHYYNSAYHPRSYSPLGVWIKHKPADKMTAAVRKVSSEPGRLHIDCPDRELLIVRNGLTTHAPRPLGGGWNEFISLSLSNSCSIDHRMIDRYMINYDTHANSPPSHSPRIRAEGSFVDDRKTVCCDSGAFQLLTGKAHWIDPVAVGKWYADNCDEGITLDLPVHGIDDLDVVLRSAEVQKKNSAIIRAQVSKDFRLFNVVHGHTNEMVDKFRKILESDPECGDYVCLGGMYFGGVPQSMFRLLRFIMHPDYRPYKQYHVLGIYNIVVMSCLIWAAAQLRKHHRSDIHLSSDARTAQVSGSNRTMQLQRNHYRNVERMFLGKNAPVWEQNPFRILPCSCPGCQALKYTDVVSHMSEAIVAHSFIYHNMWEVTRWVRMMNVYAQTLSLEDYKVLVTNQQKGTAGLRTALLTLDLTHCAITEGLDVAHRKFAPQLMTMLDDEGALQSLGDGVQEEGYAEQLRQQYGNDGFKQRVVSVLEGYEEFHRSRKAIAKSKNTTERKRTVKKVLSNSMANRAGKKKKVGGSKVDEGRATWSKKEAKK